MTNQDIVIATNIIKKLNERNITQSTLANSLNLPRQTVNKMLNGSRIINASELKNISTILNTTMESLCKIPDSITEKNILHNFVEKVKTEDAKETILIADELINMIIFHREIAKSKYIIKEEQE